MYITQYHVYNSINIVIIYYSVFSFTVKKWKPCVHRDTHFSWTLYSAQKLPWMERIGSKKTEPQTIATRESKLNSFCYYIQGDSGGICITLGNDSMSDSKQKSSYEHGSDFERLRSYGHFLIPVHALMWTALTKPAGGLGLTVCIASINFASWLAHPTSAVHNRAAACVAAAASFSKTSFKHRSIQIKGNFTKLTLHLYFKCITYYAGLLFSSVHCQ